MIRDDSYSTSTSAGRQSLRDDLASSHHSSSTERLSSTGTEKSAKEIQEELAAKETKDVNRGRAIVIVVLFCFTVLCATLTYIFTRREEQRDFEHEFLDFTYEIREVTQHNAKNVYGVVEGFSLAITSLSLFANLQWPLVSLPHFDKRARQAMKSAGADFVAFAPFVSEQQRLSWEEYTTNNHDWISEGLVNAGLALPEDSSSIPNQIHGMDNSVDEYHSSEDYYLPLWQTSPAPEHTTKVNYDLLDDPLYHDMAEFVLAQGQPGVSKVVNVTALFGEAASSMKDDPHSLLLHPVYQDFVDHDDGVSLTVGIVTFVLPWNQFLSNLLHEGVHGITLVLNDSCGDVYSYQIDGPRATFLGIEDLHNPKYDYLRQTVDFEPFEWHDQDADASRIDCHYQFYVYPSQTLENEYFTYMPVILTTAVILIFVITTGVFMAYDCLVKKRQKIVMETAQKSDAIVSSLFPKEFRDRLFKTKNSDKDMKGRKAGKSDGEHNLIGRSLSSLGEAPKFRLKTFLHDDDHQGDITDEPQKKAETDGSKPIADLFPNATVMFADIVGFTAWSSMREPSQVFTLLETLYRAFDHIAKRRHVFKVETIGDCYVAVTGLPEPRQDHAIVMARFARDCLNKMDDVMKKLEVTLGPDTADLGMRFGLHSGAVTAGILRGDKSRFQLFGDTVNTAARMESTGEKNRIQMSETTAELLIKVGKAQWTQPREHTVAVKGKGQMTTFWLHAKARRTASDAASVAARTNDDATDRHSDCSSDGESVHKGLTRRRRPSATSSKKANQKVERMIGWNVDVLLRLLKNIVAARNARKAVTKHNDTAIQELEQNLGKGSTVQDEVTEFVALPGFETCVANVLEDPGMVKLHPMVETELRSYVSLVSSMYHENPFHSFEHASHVTMSVSKLLSRIVAPEVAPDDRRKGQEKILSYMHDQTYGITSDPLTQFAAVFSALIHDVDHSGVPNFILVKENVRLASIYNGRSVAEQNSVDVAWDALMEGDFEHLRQCIYTTADELKRFRQLVVNTVMATDIFDKEFAELRRRRWDRCFNKKPDGALSQDTQHDTHSNDVHRKAAIVMEHLIQASDVAHTMQHWQVYRKWNSLLFREMYGAFQQGRSEKDPSLNWYASELGFFDNYVIPLAKKLEQCGVFGVSSDEYLNYALENRREWCNKGKDIVDELKRSV